jgi:hypothetical protein
MASTYSNLKFELIGTGEQVGTWGNTTNTNLGTAIEQAIVGTASVSFSSADVTLTLTNTNAAQDARALRLNLTGTSGGARNLILGSGCQIDKPYLINNGLADTVTVKNTTGTGVAVPAGKTMWVYNNGTNVVDAVTHLSSLTLGSALPAGSGGTGLTTPGTAGNVLTSNGTTWTSAAAAAFDAGTRMIFAQTTAPTGWTKDTSNYNQHALRVVTGTASTGGSVDFTTAFASQTPSGTVTVTASTGQVAQGGSISVSTGQAAAPVTVGDTTLSTPTIPSHSHPITSGPGGGGVAVSGSTANPGPTARGTTDSTGGGGAHTHPGTGGQHAHPASGSFTGSQHAHPVSAPATFSGSAINLAVRYLDVITATKN